MLDMLFTTDAMRAIFRDTARVQGMLDFEAALARAEAAVGVIPAAAALSIVQCCDANEFDFAALAAGARTAGNIAIPLVAALTHRVAELDPEARGYVHWGATSQDAIDTGLVLQLRDALALIDDDLDRFASALAAQIRHHRATPIVGRTWMQQAVPVTFGLKLAQVLAAVDRHRERIATLRPRMAELQFGGAVGTLASLGTRGIDVETALAADLRLEVADTPWHTQRDNLCEVAATLGLIVATTGKLARDIALLAQTEVAEAFEPSAPGRGGSSTLPHKRNPVGAAIALAAAVRVPNLVATMLSAGVQEHERGLGNWPAEWDALPEICMLAAGALDAMTGVVAGLDVDAAKMRANLDVSRGQIFAEAVQMALAPALGRDAAHALVGTLCKRAAAEGRHLRDAVRGEPQVRAILDDAALDAIFDPARYLGVADAFIDRALARH
ncbi:MAG TPA: 3-carboxy-cis,cis-muconate cycloisomerase [Casimicrobiaceae bacterium]|nr:3-carboxy-cis,cis-muconate cycloisomerase [Casimicrobiaceae bacterium]